MAESWPFQRWLKLAILEETPEEKVDRMMMLENLKIESRQDGVWVTQDKSRQFNGRTKASQAFSRGSTPLRGTQDKLLDRLVK